MIRRRGLITLTLLGLMLAVCACSLFTTVLDNADDGALRQLDVGDVVAIHLQGTPSSGYEWVRVAPESLEGGPLDVLSEGETQDADSGLVGAPCTFVFRYRALRPGTLVLTFAYRRNWEPDSAADTYSVTLWVR